MKTWRNDTFDRSRASEPGPWNSEPDKAQWVDEATGLDCLIHRAPLGHLCGYVGVPPGHPWHGIDYTQCTDACGESWCDHSPEGQIDVHGGITYSAACEDGDDPSKGICHVPEPGRPDDVWWFGFDCAHLGDMSPGMVRFSAPPRDHETYKTFDYVTAEIESLAKQLAVIR